MNYPFAFTLYIKVECTHQLLLAIKTAHDDVEILIESSTTLLNLIGPTDPMFSFHTLLQLQGAQASKFFQRLLSQVRDQLEKRLQQQGFNGYLLMYSSF